MKTLSNEKFPRTIARLLTSAFLACLVVAAVCIVALPGLAVSPAGDAQKAYDDWVAANEAVKEAKKGAQDAKDKLTNIMAVSASGGITEGEERALAKARAEVARAEAALKEAEARLEAARIEMEKAIAELEDEKLKKELIRKRDGYIAAQRFTAIAPAKASSETRSGLHTVTFDTSHGRVIVNLPDDMRAGDTISGTVIAEPNGTTKEERGANQTELNKFRISLFSRPEDKPEEVNLGDISTVFKYALIGDPEKGNVFSIGLVMGIPSNIMTKITVPVLPPTHPSGAIITPDPKITPPTHPSGAIITPDPKITPSRAVITPDPKITPAFIIPPLGQTGRPIVITGPFDGDSSTTSLSGQRIRNFGAVRSVVQDFEKNTENVSGGFGLIAESPRKAVFQAPTTVTGPIELNLKEGNVETKGTYRNVGVNLSAPKTNLLKGEKTTLTVQVSGLEGIKEPVPLTLESKGVITMEGGIYQPLMIQPSQVGADGRYTTTRGITGVQTGGWEATATVVTQRFNVSLRDDSTREMVLMWNTFNGDYIFNCPTCWPPKGTAGTTGGKTETGATIEPADPNLPPTVPPTGLTGTGRPVMKGCIITLTHNAPDRRVFARLDACTKTGDASVETTSPKTKVNITDKNTTDNTVPSPPPK